MSEPCNDVGPTGTLCIHAKGHDGFHRDANFVWSPGSPKPSDSESSVPVPRPSEPRARCAHRRIDYREEDYKYDGPDVPNPDPDSPHVGLRHGATLTRDWWECCDCKTKFAPVPSVPTATQVSQRERANAFAEILHEMIRPDNGKCNQCGAEWFYRLDGSWEYIDGEHFPHCIARRVIERRTGEIRLSAFVAELHANAPAASSEEAANSTQRDAELLNRTYHMTSVHGNVPLELTGRQILANFSGADALAARVQGEGA